VPILAFVAFLFSVAGASAQPTDPFSVLQRFLDARNAGDVAGAMALVADDIYQVGGPACTLAQPCVGRDAVQRDIVEHYIPGHAHVTIVGSPQVSGSEVKVRVETTSDLARAAGVDRWVLNLTAEVRDGKIVRSVGLLDPSDPQTATFLAFQRAHGTPVPSTLPATGDGGPFASLPLDVLVGGVVLALGLVTRRSVRAREQLGR
jgi:hypothetical protein